MTACQKRFGSGYRKRFGSRLPGRSLMRQKFFRKIAFRGVALRSLAASSAAFRGVVSRAAAVLLLGMTAANAMGAADMARPAGLFPERASADFAPQPGSPAGCHSHENPAYPAVPVTP